MRFVLLLFILLFSFQMEAKKKDVRVAVNKKAISLESTENTDLDVSVKNSINNRNSSNDPGHFITPVDGNFYYDPTISNFGESFAYSVISYKTEARGSGGMETVLQESSIQSEASLDTATVFRQGLYYGFALMLVMLNLVCFFLFDEKTFLFYSLSLASMLVLFFFNDGLFSLLGLSDTQNLLINQTLLLLIATGFSALFVSRYLSLKDFIPKLKFATIAMISLAVLTFAAGLITGDNQFIAATQIISFTVLCTYFMAGVSLFNKKNYAKFFVIGTFIPLLFSLDFFVFSLLGIDFLAIESIQIKAATIAEMLILTYAIMYRMQAIKEENMLRQAELRIFLKRQEVLTARQKTEKMVEDVYLENLIMHYDLDGLEIKLLQYISEGKENAKIARKLKTTEHEVEELTKELYDKLEIGEQIQQDYRMVEAQPDYIYN